MKKGPFTERSAFGEGLFGVSALLGFCDRSLPDLNRQWVVRCRAQPLLSKHDAEHHVVGGRGDKARTQHAEHPNHGVGCGGKRDCHHDAREHPQLGRGLAVVPGRQTRGNSKKDSQHDASDDESDHDQTSRYVVFGLRKTLSATNHDQRTFHSFNLEILECFQNFKAGKWSPSSNPRRSSAKDMGLKPEEIGLVAPAQLEARLPHRSGNGASRHLAHVGPPPLLAGRRALLVLGFLALGDGRDGECVGEKFLPRRVKNDCCRHSHLLLNGSLTAADCGRFVKSLLGSRQNPFSKLPCFFNYANLEKGSQRRPSAQDEQKVALGLVGESLSARTAGAVGHGRPDGCGLPPARKHIVLEQDDGVENARAKTDQHDGHAADPKEYEPAHQAGLQGIFDPRQPRGARL